ncbi:3-dehydroquinate synthase [Legionella beliardensis]|uniref:3-dehydroquinate synthase n=1 Tax=Legionella beliardensis TaxID=91822 RepID=A0A378I3H1_9GAMM|nr:3-dehydroquinate synthase [Legionella beliardensis]STX29727.1 3-dehydroquinate synthase [Legionella beliardensis]
MKVLKQNFSVDYHYDIYFTKGLFEPDNSIFANVVEKQAGGPAKLLIVIDERIAATLPTLCEQIESYVQLHSQTMQLCEKPLCLPGGESIKNDHHFVDTIYEHINIDGICRHSYVVAIGGGAFLDAVGFAAATAHRGIRLIRIPTTVLSQDDSGVGVKNGINYFGKKNYIGTFAPPYAVLNDYNFLASLELRDWLSGIAEAVKVSLIKDARLFHYIQSNAALLATEKKEDVLYEIIWRSAELHMKHIGTQGDPFELGSSRPLDFGHWAAHKLEQFTNYRLRHGEAVAIGLALDTTYSCLIGLLSSEEWHQVLTTLDNLNLTLYVPELSQHMENPEHPDSIFKGLIEFREHLGGELTLMMLQEIGKGIEVHSVDFDIYRKAIATLQDLFEQKQNLMQIPSNNRTQQEHLWR